MIYCDHEVGPNCSRIAVVMLHSIIDGDDQPFCRPCAKGFVERCANNQMYATDVRAIRQWLRENPEITSASANC